MKKTLPNLVPSATRSANEVRRRYREYARVFAREARRSATPVEAKKWRSLAQRALDKVKRYEVDAVGRRRALQIYESALRLESAAIADYEKRGDVQTYYELADRMRVAADVAEEANDLVLASAFRIEAGKVDDLLPKGKRR